MNAQTRTPEADLLFELAEQAHEIGRSLSGISLLIRALSNGVQNNSIDFTDAFALLERKTEDLAGELNDWPMKATAKTNGVMA